MQPQSMPINGSPCCPARMAPCTWQSAYVWLTEDTYDKEYVATHTVGFDKFSDYVLGNEEGDPEGPKTPEWAAPRCGVPAWTIKALARNWIQKRTSIVGFLGPGMRGTYSSEPTRIQACAEGMQGYGRTRTQPLWYRRRSAWTSWQHCLRHNAGTGRARTGTWP